MKQFRKMTIPYIVWMSVMIVIPMLFIFMYGITKEGNSVVTLNFTLDNFVKFFVEPIYIDVLIRSMRIAVITTFFCILLGYPAAYAISRCKEKTQTLLVLLITLPMWINMLVRTYAWMGMLQDNGLFNTILSWIGIGSVKMIHTEAAVIFVMIYNFIPFMILQIYTSLTKMDKSYLEAASDLGATPIEAFRKITLPLSLPGVVSGITLVFLPAVSTFTITSLIGGGKFSNVGNIIETLFLKSGDWNAGSALSMILAVIIMFLMYLTKKVDKDPSSGRGRV